MKSAAFSVFIHYLLLRLQTEIQIQTEVFQIQTEIFQIRTEIFQIQTEMLCFPCLQLTASLDCTPLLHFPLKSFSGSKLSMLFC